MVCLSSLLSVKVKVEFRSTHLTSLLFGFCIFFIGKWTLALYAQGLSLERPSVLLYCLYLSWKVMQKCLSFHRMFQNHYLLTWTFRTKLYSHCDAIQSFLQLCIDRLSLVNFKILPFYRSSSFTTQDTLLRMGRACKASSCT